MQINISDDKLVEEIRAARAQYPSEDINDLAAREFARACDDLLAAYDRVVADDATAERDKYRTALTKISAIRDSIVGMQGFNFSEHAYPLVAALDEAGFPGVGYEIARANLGSAFFACIAPEYVQAMVAQARAEEREACAVIVESMAGASARDIAARIRARGSKEGGT